MEPVDPPSPRVAPDTAAIVVAAGSGSRFGGRKQYEALRGRRVLDWSLASARATCGLVILVVAQGSQGDAEPDADLVVHGGATRSQSVRAGLEALASLHDDVAIVVVHDAARPLATPALFTAVIDAVRRGADAAVPGIAVVDTLRHRSPGHGPINRDDLVAVQTPQAFRASTLRAVHAVEIDATDDATLVDAHGGSVVVVPGEVENRKITEPVDLVIAGTLIDARNGRSVG